MAKTTDALKIMDQMIGDDTGVRILIAEATINAEVAQLIYDARTQAGMTQQQLAKLIGSSQPVIARLEDADYDGHSLTMLQRIAEALDRRLEITLAPRKIAA